VSRRVGYHVGHVHSPSEPQRLVVVLGRPGDELASAVASRLSERFEVHSEAIDNAAELREVAARLRERLGVLVVGAGDSTAASTLVWELDRAREGLAARTVVVVDDHAMLDAVPARLLDALTYVTADSELLEVVERVLLSTRAVDVLSTLVRSAIAHRSLDSLPPLLGDWDGVEQLDLTHLKVAHADDDGRRANPLWAAWVQQRAGGAIELLGNRLAARSLAGRAVEKG
jgi:hypothetical protein